MNEVIRWEQICPCSLIMVWYNCNGTIKSHKRVMVQDNTYKVIIVLLSYAI